MSSTQVYDCLQTIAADSSKNAKITLVKKYSTDNMFMSVIKAALDPFINFGVTGVDGTISTTNGRDWNDADWNLLSDLQQRKITGNAARDAIQATLKQLNVKSSLLFARVINKDLRCDFGQSTVNKAVPDFFKEFPYQRCSLPAVNGEKGVKIEDWNWRTGIYSQEKADGMYANYNVDEVGNVSIFRRAGNPFPLKNFQKIIDATSTVSSFNAMQTHGELLIREIETGKVQPREIGNGMLNKIEQGGDLESGFEIVYMVWDQIPMSQVKPKVNYDVPYKTRFEKLQSSVSKIKGGYVFMIETKIVYSLREAFAHYFEMLLAGKEGTVIKTPSAGWKDGTSKFQVKLKLDADFEMRIKGKNPGKGKNIATFGSLQMASEDGLLTVNVSGFTDSQRKEIMNDWDNWLGSVATIRANGILLSTKADKPHSVFLPRFVELRSDKTKADTFKCIQEQFDAAIKKIGRV